MRPKGWEEIKENIRIPVPDNIKVWGIGGIVDLVGEAYADAIVKEIALKLQAIYNIPDLKAEDVRMGEFIQNLMEEVK